MKQFLTLLIVWSLFTTCSSSGKQKETALTATAEQSKEEIPVLDLESVINKQVPDTFTWNSIAKSIKLIPISTSRGTLMGESIKLKYIGDNYYIVIDNQTQSIFKIDLNGKIQKIFRHVGKGPGEYIYLTNLHINPKDSSIQVFDNGSMKRITYDYNGKLIHEISMAEKGINNPLLKKNDYIIFRGNPESENQLYVTDSAMNIQQSLCPFDTSFSVKEKAGTLLQTNRSDNHDMLIINHHWEDSVFTVTQKGLEPLFILNKGQYALPKMEIKNIMNLLREGDPHILSLNINSIPGYYLIRYVRNNQVIEEIWRKSDNQIISRFINSEEYGFPFTFPSGNKVRLNTYTMYINENKIALFIPADMAAGEIAGVKEDDNPVLLIMEM